MILRHKEWSILIWIFLRKLRKFHFFQQLVWFVWLCSNVQTVQTNILTLIFFYFLLQSSSNRLATWNSPTSMLISMNLTYVAGVYFALLSFINEVVKWVAAHSVYYGTPFVILWWWLMWLTSCVSLTKLSASNHEKW